MSKNKEKRKKELKKEMEKLRKKLDVLDDFFPESFQSAAVVMQLHLSDERNEPIGDDRRQAAAEESIFPLSPPAADDVVSLFDFLDEKGKIVGIILQIGIKSDDNFPLSTVETG